jgi:ADP-ribose pyrophosphatase YjhB (NUDIX family)
LPAGYVDINESPAQAAVREAYEETGLQVEVKRLLDVYFFNDDPRGNGILIVYACNVIGGELAESSESMTPTFFAPGDVPADLAGGGHNRAILTWQKAQPKDS